jgi:hypothetical protein
LMGLEFPCTAQAFFPERLCNYCQSLRRTFSEMCIKFDAHSLSHPYRYRIRPGTRRHIKGRKNQHIHPRYVSTKTYRCIALPQLLDWWQHQLTNSVALARERTIPTERPPLVGEVSANFCG